ncbi:MAG TPA: ABC transporter substrate-binding protein [Candidatus Acidoferrales bacterium]|nr:ABC transporter substrate-binding protein [Candidatus Acidoferrales bacterium]
MRISRLLFSSLTRPSENSLFELELAERYERRDARTHWFRLRRGVRFHDGRPLTAADVKYTYDFILDRKNQSPFRAALGMLQAVEIRQPDEVVFRLASPHAGFLAETSLGIVPAGTPAAAGGALRTLVGSGPFSLESFLPGDRIRLRSNPAYWRGRPRLSGIEVRIIPDTVTRVLEFKKGNIDFLQNDLEPEMLPWLRARTGAQILVTPGTTFQYIGINCEHPVLRRLEVRQALAIAIDHATIIKRLLKDLAVPATGLLSPTHWAYEPSVKRWPYDPEAAKRLLDQAGFTDPDGAGPLPRFKLSYKTTTLDLRLRMAEVLKEQLAQVGVELEVRSLEWATFYSDVRKGNFHLYSLAWVGITDPDIYFNLFHSASVPPDGDNRGRYRNREIDALLDKARATLDSEKRKLLYREVQQRLALELPVIPLWWQKNVVVMQPHVRGFFPQPDGDLRALEGAYLAGSLAP